MLAEEFLEKTLPAMDMIHALARKLAPDRYRAEDLVQETYLHAFRAWPRRKPDRVEPWLATICLNLARSDYRRTRRRPDEMLQAEAGAWSTGSADTAEEAIVGIDREAVHRALWELPEEQRIAITLMDLSGLTAAETASVMGTPRGTVLSRVHRGRKSLAERLRKEVTQHEP